MFCISCGQELIEGALFCTSCGTKTIDVADKSEFAGVVAAVEYNKFNECTPAELYVRGLKKEAEGLIDEAIDLFRLAAQKGHSAALAKLQKENGIVAGIGVLAAGANVVNSIEITGAVATSNGNVVATTILNSAETARVADIGKRFANGLENLNTGRGGQYGFKGFVGEEMQAAQASLEGKLTYVKNDNGIYDLVYVGKNGHKYYQQMKIGYKPSDINFEKYKGQTLVIDKGNPHFKQFKAEGAKHGVKVVEGNITNAEAQELANLMKKEAAIRGTKTATIVPRVYSAHKAGLQSAKSGALYGGGFSLGSNLVDVACGDKELGEAAGDVAKDTAIAYGTGYVAGVVGSAVASTSAGAAAIGAVSAAGSAVASTAVGGAVVAGATATTAAIGAAGTAATAAAVGAVGTAGAAVGSAAVAATTAVAGTAAGAAVASGVAATAAAGAAVGAAAVAAAPVVAVGCVLGAGYKLIKKLWD